MQPGRQFAARRERVSVSFSLAAITAACAGAAGVAVGCTFGPTTEGPDAGEDGPSGPSPDGAPVGAAPIDCSGALTSSTATSITARADAQRTGWYPNQPGLSPAIVGGPTFGRLFKTKLPLADPEVVMAQPLVVGSTVFVATALNDLYVLDAMSGAVLASRSVGPYLTNTDVACPDQPQIGITGTPVIDPATGTAYFFSKTFESNSSAAAWYAHAVDVQTLAERPNFPVPITGAATNDPTVAFDPLYESQRPALLLLDGVVYAAFGSHCDNGPYFGFVVGVGEQGGVTTMFATESGPSHVRGSGLWQSGGGIVSDGPGQLLVITGNSFTNVMLGPVPGKTPPASLGQSTVRLQVQPDGSLTATDFFAPYDAPMLDAANLDFGSGGPMALPDCFGTKAHPHLLVAAGKEATVYLLDRDDLGGFEEGPSQGDAVVSMVTAREGLWSTPAVWPGDGGWVYITPKHAPFQALRYGVRADGVPTLVPVGTTTDTFEFFSGSPIVTSDGTTSGSALVWVAYAAGAWAAGSLRAYAPLPDASGNMDVVYEDSYGQSSKYAVPGVGDGTLYVGTSDGYVLGYGAPAPASVSAKALNFGAVAVGGKATLDAVVTASQATQVTQVTQVTSVSSDGAAFTVGSPSPALPATLAAGGVLRIPVTFAPSAGGEYLGALSLSTAGGAAAVSLTGIGQALRAQVVATPKALAFEGIPPGSTEELDVAIANVGAAPLQIQSVSLPRTPFSVAGAPASGDVIPSGDTVTLTATYAPTGSGMYSDTIVLGTNAGPLSVYLGGASAAAAEFDVAPLMLDFGTVEVGQVGTASFTMSNGGGTNLTITNSTPPSLGTFEATMMLQQGTIIAPNDSLSEMVEFRPLKVGTFTDAWRINSSAGGGAQEVMMVGTAVAPPTSNPGDAGDAGAD
jgi:hypothetical protein